MSGIFFILFSTLFSVCMSAFAKSLANFMDPVEIAFWRNLVAFLLLLAYVLFSKKLNVLKTKRPIGQLWRAVIGNVGIILFFWGAALLPLPGFVALQYTTPLFTILLSSLILKEYVGPYRTLGVAVGFSSILLIVDPFSSTYLLQGVIIALTASLCSAIVVITLRDLGKTENPMTTVLYFHGIGTFAIGLYLVICGFAVSPSIVYLIIGIGIVGLLHQLAKTQAYKLSEASLLAPYTYTSIIWATLIGFIIWGDFPAPITWVGIALIIAANLFIWHRERIKKKAQP